MKINWKEVARSEGYLSMKATVTENANRNWGPDKRYPETFAFAINRAKQHIYVSCWLKEHDYTNDLIFLLNEWERKRNMNFLNYYSSYSKFMTKKTSNVIHPQGIRGRIKYYKNEHWCKDSNKAAKELTLHLQKIRTKKARWNNKRKADAKYWRDRGL